jgi:streptogrisin C
MLHRHARSACVGAVAAGALILTALHGAASAQQTGSGPAARTAADTLAVSAAQPELSGPCSGTSASPGPRRSGGW